MPRAARPRKFREYYVTDAGGKMVKLCFISEGIAVANQRLRVHLEKLRDEKREREKAGLAIGSQELTVEGAVLMFLDHKEKTKPERLEWCMGYLKPLIAFCGNESVNKLKLPRGKEYKARIGAMKTKKGTTVKNNTVRHHIQAAKEMLNFCVESDLLGRNPWRKLDMPPGDRRQRIVTDDDFNALIAACDQTRKWRGMSMEEVAQTKKDAIRLLRFTGLRPEELRLLKWKFIDPNRPLIVIPEHKTSETSRVREAREVALDDDAMEIINRRREHYGQDEFVFTMAGRPWTEDTFPQMFKRVRDRAGLGIPDVNGEVVTAYHLRHARLSEAVLDDLVPLPAVQKLAGHRQITTTQIYLHQHKDDYIKSVRAGRERGKQKAQAADDR